MCSSAIPGAGTAGATSLPTCGGKYGTIDYSDIMAFTDKVLEKYPQIDAQKLCVTGGSYGGFMTNWIIGHTNRFRAAATQRSIANWVGFGFTSDIGEDFARDQMGLGARGNVWNSMEKMWFHSPLKYLDKAATPTLVLHSDEDYRCPLSEGYQVYAALQQRGVETRMVIFHGGKPRALPGRQAPPPCPQAKGNHPVVRKAHLKIYETQGGCTPGNSRPGAVSWRSRLCKRKTHVRAGGRFCPRAEDEKMALLGSNPHKTWVFEQCHVALFGEITILL